MLARRRRDPMAARHAATFEVPLVELPVDHDRDAVWCSWRSEDLAACVYDLRTEARLVERRESRALRRADAGTR